MNDLSSVKPLYPGAYPPSDTEERDAPYPKAPLNLTLGFDLETFQKSAGRVDAFPKGAGRLYDHAQVQADRVLDPGNRID